MIFSKVITIPKNTSEADAIETTLKITSGLIWLAEIYFPPGCCALARCQVFDGSYQLFPCNAGEYLAGEGGELSFEDLYFKTKAPFELKILTWNLDDMWDHTLTFRFGLAMTRAEMSRYIPAMAFEEFEKIMAEMILNQEAVKQLQIENLLNELTG